MKTFHLSGKKILVILPPRQFRDEEYQKPKALFDESGARVTVASSTLAPAQGMLGTVVTPDASIKDVKATDFDAVLLVGGIGSNAFWHHEIVHNLVKESVRAGKVVSAICLAPVTLANAGLLEGKLLAHRVTQRTPSPSCSLLIGEQGTDDDGNGEPQQSFDQEKQKTEFCKSLEI